MLSSTLAFPDFLVDCLWIGTATFFLSLHSVGLLHHIFNSPRAIYLSISIYPHTHTLIMGGMFGHPPNSYVEALTASAVIFRDEAFGR